jgi:Protein of unknown function (DUF3443)
MRGLDPLVAALLALLVALVLTACGGGERSDAGPAVNASSATNPATAPQVPLSANAAAVSVDSGVSGVPNLPSVSITVCAPGTSDCLTIDHVLVDTGSSGLRVFASQLPPSMVLPQQDGAGNPLAECMQFFDGYTWGPVKLADVQIAGEKAASLPVQVVDPTYATIPDDCAHTGATRNTPDALAANGVLGIGVFKHDCGAVCVQQAVPATYYTCTGSSCVSTAIAEALQVANPVPYFTTDNNGSMLSLPAIGSAGAASLTGQLVFGIGTENNNGLGNAQVIGVSASDGTFTTVENGTTYPASIIDSGSTALFFETSTLPVCTAPDDAYYCPASTRQLSATMTGVNGVRSTVPFSVGNATTLRQTYIGDPVLPLLAGPAFVTSKIFDWGLPFFYGRNVYTAIEQQPTPGGTGPYFAY